MDEAIDFFQNIVTDASNSANVAVSYLVKLCKAIKKDKSPRLFHRHIREITDFFKSYTCPKTVYKCKWIAIRGVLSECFFKGLGDSDTISKIVSCMEDCSTCVRTDFLLHVETSFLNLALQLNTVEEKGFVERQIACFEHFLRYANERRLELHGTRVVCLVQLALPSGMNIMATKKQPGYVLLTLKYGARLSDRERICGSYVPDILSFILHLLINHGVDQKQWNRDNLELLVEPSKMTTEVKNMCLTFQAFLRDTYNPHEATYYMAVLWSESHPGPALERILLFYDKLFPGCHYGRRTPSSLGHMCRHLIRKALFDNWKLPDGIQSLPIPGLLKDYLNLLFD